MGIWGVAKISFATEKKSADWRRSRERSGEETTKGEKKAGKGRKGAEIFFGCVEKVVLPSRVKEEEGRKRKILNIFTAAAFSAVQ